MTLTTHHTELQNCEKCLPSREATSNFAHLPFTFQPTLILVMFFFLATKKLPWGQSGRFFCWRCLLIRSCQKIKKSTQQISTNTGLLTSTRVNAPFKEYFSSSGPCNLETESPPKNGPKLYEASLFFPPRNHVLKKNTSESSVVYRWITTRIKNTMVTTYPKYPDPSKLAILRTLPLRQTGSNRSIGGSNDP